MIEEHPPRGRQFDAARTSYQQLNAEFEFEIVHLAAQRRLRRMQPLLCRDGQTAFFGNRDEISEVPELHGDSSLKSMALTLQSLSPGRQCGLHRQQQ